MAKCKHKWYVSATSGVPARSKLRKSYWPQIYFRCVNCTDTKQRDMTEKEIVKHREQQREEEAHASQVHTLWHLFVKRFQADGKWKYQGYELMKRVRKFAAAHPEIIITGCDDNHFCSSDIVFVPHEADGKWMGATMMIISQHGNPPVDIFLYPGHAQGLVDSLFQLHKGKKIERYQRRRGLRKRTRRTNDYSL